MDKKLVKINHYQRLFLFEEGYLINSEKPAGILEMYSEEGSWIIKGEVFDKGIKLERMKLALKVRALNGKESLIGPLQFSKREFGGFKLRTRRLASMGGYSQISLCEKASFGEPAWKPLFSAVLNPSALADGKKAENPEEYSKPGEYLWDSRIAKEFPFLLEQVMEKVEAITEKVSTLEEMRTQKSCSVSGIKKVEPFIPPLTNYKWWRIS